MGDMFASTKGTAELDESELEEYVIFEGNTKKVADMTPQEYEAHKGRQAAGKQWLADHPIDHTNIVHHFHQATGDEHSHGMAWYSDAHHMNKILARDSNVDTHTMAGLVSNYSPQTNWAANMHTASRVARTKTPLGGKGGGVFASSKQSEVAGRILGGESYKTALKGQKTKAFAHLVEHGEHKGDPDIHPVVVDRHALSVARGARITDSAFGQAGLNTKKGYTEAANAYHKAAEQISKDVGYKVHPHQVQAVTWLVRQRLNKHEESGVNHNHADFANENHEEDHETAPKVEKVSKTAARALKDTAKWHDYAKVHHPDVVGKEPGTGYSLKSREAGGTAPSKVY